MIQMETTKSNLNRLRAGVLGANDGIVSTASVVMGVAGATSSDNSAIFTAGLAALVAGALSMAVGEYVSVSSQSDAEKAFIDKERMELKTDPDGELKELAQHYEELGITKNTAMQVAKELTKNDPLKAHLQAEFNLDEDEINNPFDAGLSSMIGFTLGGLIPFLVVILTPDEYKLWATVAAVLVALFLVGYFSATAGGASRRKAITRVVIGGLLAMAVTFGIGMLFGTQV